MKLRKLVMCMLVGLILFGCAGVNVLAEEISNDPMTATVDATKEDTIEETEDIENDVEEDIEDMEATEEENDDNDKNEVERKITVPKKYSEADLRLLSCLIYCEAGSESYNGKLAVGIVVMNRKSSSRFPNTVKGVIFQRYQFGPVRNGSLNRALSQYDNGKFNSSLEKACVKAAKAALGGTKIITVSGKKIDFSKYLFFSGYLKNATFKLGNHQFK